MKATDAMPLGTAFVTLLGLYVLALAVWKDWFRRTPIWRMAHEDTTLVEKRVVDGDRLRKDVFPALTSAVGSLAGIAAGILFVLVTIIVTSVQNLDTFTTALLLTVVGLLLLATVCWILALEQLSEMVTPSLNEHKMLGLYKQSMDLWVLGIVLIIMALHYAVVLVYAPISMAVGLITVWITIRYHATLHGW